MRKYRVIVKVGYNNAYFDFDDAAQAAGFAELVIAHSVECEDTKRAMRVYIEVFDPTNEEEEEV